MDVPCATRQPERRTCRRFPCRVALTPNVEMVDISEGGAQLECGWFVPVNAIVPLPMETVFRFQREQVVPFKVIHVRALGETGRYRVHGCFLNRSAMDADSIRSAVDRIAARR